mmetsp:Transcript_26763/g.62419  ORF Transcript_26763/g.62419 Transcript_26763/m.62419 type:complete len:504 (-) Transcript_26763:247-1758(-)
MPNMKRVTVEPHQASSIAVSWRAPRKHKTLGNIQISDSDAPTVASPSGWFSGTGKPATPPLPPVEKSSPSANHSPMANRSARRYQTVHAGVLVPHLMSESTSLPALSDSRPLSPGSMSPTATEIRRTVRRVGTLRPSASSSNLLGMGTHAGSPRPPANPQVSGSLPRPAGSPRPTGTQPARSLLRRSHTTRAKDNEHDSPAVSKFTRGQIFAQNRVSRRSRTALSVDTDAPSAADILEKIDDNGNSVEKEKRKRLPQLDSPNGSSSPQNFERRTAKAVTYAPTREKGDMRAPLLATRHRLELHEVRHILREFDEMLKSEGKDPKDEPKINIEDFQRFLCRVFEVPSLPDETLRSAAQACCGADGRITVEAFLLWYHINMFTVVNSLNSDTQQLSANSMIYDLARKHQVSTMVIDKVKAKFDLYDADGSGLIDLDEFRYLLTVLMKVKTESDLSQDRVLRAWKDLRTRGSLCYHQGRRERGRARGGRRQGRPRRGDRQREQRWR